jgi:hypothetical protein
MEVGTGNVQAEYGVQYRLPTSLIEYQFQRWDTRGQTGLKNGVGALAPTSFLNAINTLLHELAVNMGTPLLEMAGLYGAN